MKSSRPLNHCVKLEGMSAREESSVLMRYSVQSFQKFFVLLFFRTRPLMRKAICKYIPRAWTWLN